ncbi:hypothetical protein ES332_A11G094100v1 [Gossypium tomentosum]|uniref:Uncharacterized protein n=1 Tax=Gossypium tomentosum TaxID=34277 RepID=A0A5D2N7B6_GOSTO|nr:hypothetical protein ES332_A11G094100v1 [Gossypium tomentosum]
MEGLLQAGSSYFYYKLISIQSFGSASRRSRLQRKTR